MEEIAPAHSSKSASQNPVPPDPVARV